MNINPTIEKYGKKAWNLAKRVRPGHIMFGAMLIMTCMSKCTTPNVQGKGQAEFMKWSYEMGEQRIRDSIKIAEQNAKILELESKIVADSMKLYHNMPKSIKIK